MGFKLRLGPENPEGHGESEYLVLKIKGVRQTRNCAVSIGVGNEAKGRTKLIFAIRVALKECETYANLSRRGDGGGRAEGTSEEELLVELDWRIKSKYAEKIFRRSLYGVAQGAGHKSKSVVELWSAPARHCIYSRPDQTGEIDSIAINSYSTTSICSGPEA